MQLKGPPMSLAFTLLLATAPLSICCPIVGLLAFRKGRDPHSAGIVLGCIFCSLTLLLVLLELASYSTRGDVATLLDTVEAFSMTSCAFTLVSLITNVICYALTTLRAHR